MANYLNSITTSLFILLSVSCIAIDNKFLWVSTLSSLNNPTGVEYGTYNGHQGVFVSSFATHSIHFLYQYNSHIATTTIIANSADNIDGSLSHASIADPSRMYYDEVLHTLFVASRQSLTIRVVDLNNHYVSTMTSSSRDPIDFGSPLEYSDFPGMDIQGISGEMLFVTDTSSVCAIFANNYHDIATSATINEYKSVRKYMQMHNYVDPRIYSASPDTNHRLLYVAVSYSNHVILSVPIMSFDASDYSDVTHVIGSSVAWCGSPELQEPPRAHNGYFNDATLAFPMHIRYSSLSNALYWSEAYPYVGDYLLGSLSIRKISLSSGYVETVAGVDFSQDTETYDYLGTTGGHTNGASTSAAFSYPISIALSSNSDELYVADRLNNEVRIILSGALVLASSPPTLRPSPHPSRIPTLFPSPRPTPYPIRSPRPTISAVPTAEATLHPSISVAPSLKPTPRPTRKPSIGPSKSPTFSPTKVRVIVDDISLFHRIGLGHVHVGVGMVLASTAIGLFLGGVILATYWMTQRRRHEFVPLRQDSSHAKSPPPQTPVQRMLRMMSRAPPKSADPAPVESDVSDEVDNFVNSLTSDPSRHGQTIRVHEEHENISRDRSLLDYSFDSRYSFPDSTDGL